MTNIIKKKGDTQYNAAWLIGIIGLFLIVYIILLPTGEREKLVGEQPILGDQYPQGGNKVISGLLLSENPGLVYPPHERVISTPLASINLFSYGDISYEPLATLFTVEKSFFRNQQKELDFFIQDLRTVEEAELLFLVRKGKGDLVIELNGEEIFHGDAVDDYLPLSLPMPQLGNTNTLTFRAEKKGINIFGSSMYELKDVTVILKKRVENNQEVRSFVVSSADLSNLRSMTLHFIVNCFTVQEQSRLLVALNGKVLSDGLIVCDAGPVAIEIAAMDLAPERNFLTFAIDKGQYVLEQMLLEKNVGKSDLNRYIFTTQVADLQRLQMGGHGIVELIFTPTGLRKIGAIYINGFPVYFDTVGDHFTFDISPFLVPGSNSLRIIPDVPVEIMTLNAGIV